MDEEKTKLEVLKEEYSKIQEKYDLPDFVFLNENFEIENIETEQTEILLKKIRKQIVEKVSSGLHALEMFLNPQTAPIFILSIIKSFSRTDKEIIEELYARFAQFEIDAFGLENQYDANKEVEFIRKICKEWPDICKDFDRIYASMKANYKKDIKKNDKSYLG